MTNDQPSFSHTGNKKPKRHFFLKVLILVFLAMACFGWLRFFNSLQLWNMLEALGLKVSPLYLAASGAFWGLLGLCCALSLFFGWRHAAWLARLGTVAAVLLYWVDDLWLTDSGASHAGRPFAIVLTLLLIALVFSVLELPAQKAFFARRKF